MKKKKNTGIKVVITFFMFMLVIMAVMTVLLMKQMNDTKESDAKLTALQQQIDMNKQFVYVALSDLKKGTVLEEDVNVMIQEMVTALPESAYITSEDMGKTLTVDVAYEEPIMWSMVTEEELFKDTREVEIGVAHIMVDQQENDYVDIRIMFPNGEDYIVIPKIKVKNLLTENCIFYSNLSESEILTLASATIDAYTISGTKIYTTRYVDANLQEAAIPNYPVREDILSLIATDPNVLKVAQQTLNYSARKAMEEKIHALDKDYLDCVVNGHGIVDTANATAWTNRVSEEAAKQVDAEYQQSIQDIQDEPLTEGEEINE